MAEIRQYFNWAINGRAVAALAIVWSVGCGDNIQPSINNAPDDVVWSSAHFDYDTRAAESAACPAVLTTLEQHRTAVMSYLGLPDTNQRITYQKYLDASDFEGSGACPPDASGCEHDATVASPEVFHQHELVHAYLNGWGRPPPLIAEGIAEALSCNGSIPSRPFPTPDWRELGPPSQPEVYPAGRWFVGYLLHAFGPGPFLLLYQGDWYTASADEIQSRFASVYGRDMDDLWQEAFTTYPEPDTICARVWECASPPISLAGDALDLSERCDGSGQFGTVTVDQPALLSLQGGFDMSVQGCGDGGPHIDPPGGVDAIVVELQPGTVFLTTDTNDPPWHATLGAALDGGDACPVAPFPSAATDGVISWTFAARARSGSLLVALPTTIEGGFLRTGDPGNVGAPESANVDLCTDCSAASCTPLSASETDGTAGALRIQTTTAAPDGFVYVRLAVYPAAAP